MDTRIKKGISIIRNEGIIEFIYQVIRHILSKHNIKTRPSKTYFHYIFDKDIERYSHCERAADIAASDFKNIDNFNCDIYYGVDNDERRLREGMKKIKEDSQTAFIDGELTQKKLSQHCTYNKPMYIAINGDMRNQIFPDSSLDLIASTHTLHHIPPSDHEAVVRNFCQWLRPNGTLLLQISNKEWYNSDIQNILDENFSHLESKLYKTPFSAVYERIIYSFFGGQANTRLGKLLYLFFSLFLLPIEKSSLTGGQYIYVRCKGRRS
ncbi:class I SAM-dependent methyltransferase [Natronomonas sp. F2-12]|jgi:SAM-dependent methyltransferase|uniref:Class I SAM-dependent methyltransferase n=1 Tax=Natronomonas aquatica TaxID=2841590 RepID=A0A9R1CVY8_9EURY|nr:class I SAM-dependent methyltransferase [Natronomonas aquatica]MCQ4334952.1 class I SAM-dependent methyltransferase [Natronomonas aquatica]